MKIKMEEIREKLNSGLTEFFESASQEELELLNEVSYQRMIDLVVHKNHHESMEDDYKQTFELMDVEPNNEVSKEQFANHVKILAKDGNEILPTMSAEKCDLLHMVMGVSGEVGELTDAVKKHVFYNQPLDVENAREELGDILFYVQGVMNNLGFDMDDILQENIDKLSKRYPDGYSDAHAKARLDKGS